METKITFKCLLVAFLMLGFGSQVDGSISRNLNVTAGNLGAQLGSELNSITDLVLAGNINGTDIGVLRGMPNLSVLNLADVNIVAGGSFDIDGKSVFVADNQVPDSMFYKLANLTSVTVPNSVTFIGQFAFHDCSGLTSVTFGNNVAKIGLAVFCGSLQLIEFVVSESNAKFCSFEGVLFSKDKDVLVRYPSGKSNTYTVPGTVISIESHAFCTSSGLTSVVIPSSVVSIGKEAFCDCSGLTEIHCQALLPPTTSLAAFYNANQNNCKLYVPVGTSVSYRNAVGWGDFKNIIEETQTVVPEITTNNTAVYTDHDAIVIIGANIGETISVYTPFGNLMQSIKAKGEEIRINVPDNQIYIVKIAGKIYKVAL